MKTKTKRLQMDISEETFNRLKSLKEKSDASSFAEVTNKAFKLYEFFLKATEENKKITLVNTKGEITEIKLI